MSAGFSPAESVVPAEDAGTPEASLVTAVPLGRLVDLDPAQPAAGATAVNAGPADIPDRPSVTAAGEPLGDAEPPASAQSPWSFPGDTAERVAFSFNLGKVAGQGEDADPILHQARDLGLVGVFDGMGGAGGTSYDTAEGARTGAYLASRATRTIVDQRMLELLGATAQMDGPTVASDLHDSIEAALRTRLAELHTPRSNLRSKLLRALPTTMAIAAVKGSGSSDPWECHLFWAGDSRIYLMDPARGVAQLTTDDIKDHGDAMANLRQDSTISNAMSADTAFVVNHREVVLSSPFVLVAATDGCFGYLPTPMHFEWLLLSTLRDATNADIWSESLQARISAVSGDDASMALLGIGADHQGFQSLFADRTALVAEQWVDPLDQLDADVADLEQQLDELKQRQAGQTAELWAAYRPDYEHYLDVDPVRAVGTARAVDTAEQDTR